MLTDLRKRIDKHNEKFKKELKYIKYNQSELKSTITEKKNTLEGMNSRIGDTEEHISDLEDKMMPNTQSK